MADKSPNVGGIDAIIPGNSTMGLGLTKEEQEINMLVLYKQVAL